MKKKRVLVCGEASFLHTGYSVYGKELLTRLHAMDEFELAEFGAFAHTNDQRVAGLPWKFYGNFPDNPEQQAIYNSSIFNSFGAWRFNDVLTHFKPDVVTEIRDIWMAQHEVESALRPYFAHIYMPTVDSYGQDPSWLYSFSTSDYLTTYQDWSLEVLKNEAGDLLNTTIATPMAANPNAYRPLDKAAIKQNYFSSQDINIVGMVARNQIRKLFPHLLEAFKLTLEKMPKSVADKTVLYLHTSFPDAGWPIDRMVAESGLTNKILFTYICKNCRHFQPNFFTTKVSHCPKCGAYLFMMPSVELGLSENDLGVIMNLFDVYVQYHISEGFGAPQIEAAYCGVPVMGTDFSASEDILRKIGGTPIKVSQYFREAPTYMTRAFPDDQDLADKLSKFLMRPQTIRNAVGQRTRLLAMEHFNYDKTAEGWASLIRKSEPKRAWNAPLQVLHPAQQIPNIPNNEDFVRWCFLNILRDPSKLDTYFHMKVLKDLNEGVTIEGAFGYIINDSSMLTQKPNFIEFNREKLIKFLMAMRENINYWEGKRVERCH